MQVASRSYERSHAASRRQIRNVGFTTETRSPQRKEGEADRKFINRRGRRGRGSTARTTRSGRGFCGL